MSPRTFWLLAGTSAVVATLDLRLILPLFAAALVVGARERAAGARAGGVHAIRMDPDFGRLGLFGDGIWRGAVELAAGERPLDLELAVDGAGPTLAHRLALCDLQRRWPAVRAELAALLRERVDDPLARPTFLTLQLPRESEFPAQDGAVGGVLERTGDETAFRVRLRSGHVLGLELGPERARGRAA